MENKSSENEDTMLNKIQIDTFTAPDNSWVINIEHTGEISDFEWVEGDNEEEVTSDDNLYGEYNQKYNE